MGHRDSATRYTYHMCNCTEDSDFECLGAKKEIVMSITITAHLFEAFLKCPTKCYLRSLCETGTENTYADWFRTRSASYRDDGIRRLIDSIPEDERVTGLYAKVSLKAATWRLAVDLVAPAHNLESVIHAVEQVLPRKQGQPAQFVPFDLSSQISSLSMISYWWLSMR